MNTREFCKELAGQITHAEWDALDCCDPSLLINSHNREALLEMRALCMMPDAAKTSDKVDGSVDSTPGSSLDIANEHTQPEPEVDLQAAESLAHYLQEYLDKYMSDRPEGHKWIVLASLYLAFVARRPLHPIDRAGVVVEQRDGATIYRCPIKVPGDNPICDACVCLA